LCKNYFKPLENTKRAGKGGESTMKGLSKILQQAQKMESKMAKIQEELAEKTVEATSGGGMVTVTANGQREILEIKIEPEVVDKEDVAMLEDLIVAAINEALSRADELAKEEMSKLTMGLNIPGTQGLNPFGKR